MVKATHFEIGTCCCLSVNCISDT